MHQGSLLQPWRPGWPGPGPALQHRARHAHHHAPHHAPGDHARHGLIPPLVRGARGARVFPAFHGARAGRAVVRRPGDHPLCCPHVFRHGPGCGCPGGFHRALRGLVARGPRPSGVPDGILPGDLPACRLHAHGGHCDPPDVLPGVRRAHCGVPGVRLYGHPCGHVRLDGRRGLPGRCAHLCAHRSVHHSGPQEDVRPCARLR